MNLIWLSAYLLLLLLRTHSTQAKDEIDNDISNGDPEFTGSTPTTTANSLDANLRKALLRALSELENEETSSSDTAVFFSSTLRTAERIVEKAPAAAISFVANDTPEKQAEDGDVEANTEKPIVIIQKSAGIQHRPIISVLNDAPNEELSLSATTSFTDDPEVKNFVRGSPKMSLNPNAVTVNDKSFTPGIKSISITPKFDTTTSTTTLRPTTSTEESEAKVETVQFFSAPLVAAFTVHQDERGLPNKVEPIFRQPGQSTVSVSEVEQKERDEVLHEEEVQRNKFRQQLELEAKQKALVQQVLSLQEQHKQQQEHLLRQQRIIHEQQLQHQRFVQEQHRLSNNDRPFIPIISTSPSTTERPLFFTTASSTSFNTGNLVTPALSAPNPPSFFQELPRSTPSPIFNQQGNPHRFNSFTTFTNLNFNKNPPTTFHSTKDTHTKFPNTLVSFQPSVSLSPSDLQAGKLPLNAQILPIRNAIDFLQSPNPNTNIDLRPPSQQILTNSFQQFPNTFVQSLPVVRQGNRVFRHETGVGNFGTFGNQFNHFNGNPPPLSFEPSTRFFRSNAEGFQQVPGHAFQAQNVNQQLNTLLFHSGITRNVRQNDDLQLVSKILSYNLGRDNLFVGTRLNEQRLPRH